MPWLTITSAGVGRGAAPAARRLLPAAPARAGGEGEGEGEGATGCGHGRSWRLVAVAPP